MLVVVLFGIALGAGVYYGVRSFYRDAIEPLQTLDQRMREMEASVAQLSDALREERSSTADERSELQARTASQAEELGSMTAQIARIENQIEEQEDALDEIEQLREGLNQIETDLTLTGEQLEELKNQVAAGDLPVERVEQNLQLMRVMNLMTRARLWIEQDNFGLADDDLQVALEIMQLLVEGEASAQDSEPLQQISDHLTLALEVVRSNPGLAEEELEIAWKLLIEVTAP
jgi:chromosome segregation ATPase